VPAGDATIAAAPPARGTPTAPGTTTDTATATPVRTHAFDAATVQNAHVDALRTAGSFRTTSALLIRNASSRRYINGSYSVEREGPVLNSANITHVTDGGTRDYPVTTRYTAGDTTYERRLEANGTVYPKGTAPYDDSDPDPVDPTGAFRLGRIAYAVVDASTWTPTGTDTIEGANVTRYDTDDTAFDAAGYADATGTATLVIDEYGVVRYVAYRFVATQGGTRTEYVYEAGYTGVGTTSVDRPEWTENA
jgi:hypothetical protein